MENNNPADILSVSADAINVEALMRELRAAITQRKKDAEAKGIDFEKLAMGRYEISEGERFQSQVYEAIYTMTSLRDKSQVQPFVTPIAVPLIGPLIQKIRGALHMISIFYVNMSAERQIAFNVATARAVGSLARALDKEAETAPKADDIAQLKQEIARLQTRISELEKRA